MKESRIFIQQMQLGPMENFIYFLGDKLTKEIAVVDPAWDVDFLRDQASKQGLTITAILLTHGHPDHVNGLPGLLSTHDVPVYFSQHEAPFLTPKHGNIQKTTDNTKLTIGGLEVTCLHTPGHTPGSQCFLAEGHMIAGDTVFIDGCGRCDLPGGDAKVMFSSLDKVKKLPDTTVIYPGHNYGPTPHDTLAHQKKTNPYLAYDNLQDFLQERMGLSF